jgi:hypothetical protein
MLLGKDALRISGWANFGVADLFRMAKLYALQRVRCRGLIADYNLSNYAAITDAFRSLLILLQRCRIMTFLNWIHSVRTASLKLGALFITGYLIAVYGRKADLAT